MNNGRLSHRVDVSGIAIGGGAPVVVQSMTNTDTADIEATVQQVKLLADAGSELVRITVNNDAAARAVPHIAERLERLDCRVPLIGDFHFNGHKLLAEHEACARALAKYRINPGNVGRGKKRDPQFSQMVEIACRHDKPVRIGVNWGSLDQQLLANLLTRNAQLADPLPLEAINRQAVIDSALESAAFAEHIGLPAERIVISCKMSRVPDLVEVYRKLAARCQYALHLGLTEAGMGDQGIVASSAALAILLHQGIGDTIRVSLTPEPGATREREVRIAQQILQSLGIRAFSPSVTACPGCGRTTSEYFQVLARQIQQELDASMPRWKKIYPGVESLKVAVMGCVVRRAAGGAGLRGRTENRDAEGRANRRGIHRPGKGLRQKPLRAALNAAHQGPLSSNRQALW